MDSRRIALHYIIVDTTFSIRFLASFNWNWRQQGDSLGCRGNFLAAKIANEKIK